MAAGLPAQTCALSCCCCCRTLLVEAALPAPPRPCRRSRQFPLFVSQDFDAEGVQDVVARVREGVGAGEGSQPLLPACARAVQSV